MKKAYLNLCICGILTGFLSSTYGRIDKVVHFVAPNVNDHLNSISVPTPGQIIYDPGQGRLYGYDSLNPAWIDLSSPSATNTSSSQISNLGLSVFAGCNMVIDVKQADGSSPSTGAGSVLIGFKNAGSSGGYVQKAITGALSMEIATLSTLGVVFIYNNYIYVYAIDYEGAVELAVSSQKFDDGSLVSTTAEGAGTADSVNVMYSTVARSNVPSRLIGRLLMNYNTCWSSAGEIALQPFSKGEVTSGLIAGMRTEAAEITSGGVVTEIGSVDWISGNCSNAAPYSCTINTGVFSGTPACLFTANADQKKPYGYSFSNTGFSYDTYTTSTMARANGGVHVVCMGPR